MLGESSGNLRFADFPWVECPDLIAWDLSVVRIRGRNANVDEDAHENFDWVRMLHRLITPNRTRDARRGLFVCI